MEFNAKKIILCVQILNEKWTIGVWWLRPLVGPIVSPLRHSEGLKAVSKEVRRHKKNKDGTSTEY